MEREIRVGRPANDALEALCDHLLDVADSLFIENGFEGTSIANIASQARIGKQTLYRRYPDKAALFQAVVQRRIGGLAAPLASPGMTDEPLDQLKRLGKAVLNTVLDPDFTQLYRIVIAEAVRFPELACSASDTWGAGFMTRCILAIEAAQAKGDCRLGDARAMASYFVWALIGEPFNMILTGETPLTTAAERDAHLNRVWTLFLNGISSP